MSNPPTSSGQGSANANDSNVVKHWYNPWSWKNGRSEEPPVYKRLGFWVIVALVAAIVLSTGFFNNVSALNGGWWSRIIWLAFAAFFIYWGVGAARRYRKKQANTKDREAAEQSSDLNVIDTETVDLTGARQHQTDPPDTSERRFVMSVFTKIKPYVPVALATFVTTALICWIGFLLHSSWSIEKSDIFTSVIIAGLVTLATVAVAWFIDRRQTSNTTTTRVRGKRFIKFREYVSAIEWSGKKVATAAFVFVVLALIAGVFIGKSVAPNGQVVQVAGVSQEQVTQQINTELAEIKKDLAKAEARAIDAETKRADAEKQRDEANTKLTNNPGVQLANNSYTQEDVVRNALASRGVDKANMRFGGDIDQALARSIAPGGGVFGPTVLNGNELVSWLLTGEPGAKELMQYLRECTNASDAEIMDPKSYVAVQVMEDLQWNQNLSFSNGVVTNSGNSVDPAGAVAIFFVGNKEVESKSLSLCGVRAHCINPQGAMPSAPNFVTVDRPIGGGHYTPPTPPTGNGCVSDCVPVNPPEECVDEPGTPEDECNPNPPCVDNPSTPEDECNPNPPCVDEPGTPEDECNPTPPCVDNPSTPGDDCNPNPPCVDNPSTPTDECNPNPPCVDNPSTPEDECNPNPPCVDEPGKPCEPVEPPKCSDPGTDGICGTQDDGGEQQDPQNNGDLADPTPGYNPGDAEEIIDNQDVCTGVLCALDPTEHGTVIDGSEDGGFAPGGHVTEPVPGTDGTVVDNPNADGTPPSTNPDLGTAAPEDSTIVGETVDSGNSEWDSGFTLPSFAAPVEEPAYVAPVQESTYVAPAPAESTYVEPAPVVYEEAPATSYSTPADTSVSSSSATDQSTLATVTDITSASSHSSTLDNSTSNTNDSSFGSASGSASDSDSSIDDSSSEAA